MKAVITDIKHLHSDEEVHAAEGGKAFVFMVDVILRRPSDPPNSGDNFSIWVCNPQYIAEQVAKERHLWGKHLFIAEAWNWPLIASSIQALVDRNEGDTWTDLCMKINEFMQWEFAGYDAGASTAP
jgi:hypothetical protein